MAVTPRGIGTGFNTGVAVTTVTNSVPTGTGLDDLIVWHFAGNVTTDPTLTSGWTVLQSTTTTGLRSCTWYRWATASEPSSYSVTVASARWCGVMMSYSGVDKTTPFDVTTPAGTTGTTTSLQPAITPTTAGAVIISAPSNLTTSGNNQLLSSSNLDAIDVQTRCTAASGSANPAVALGEEAWTSGAFTPVITASLATTRSLGRTFALRPGPPPAYSGTAALSGSGTLYAIGVIPGGPQFVGSAQVEATPVAGGTLAVPYPASGILSGDIALFAYSNTIATVPPDFSGWTTIAKGSSTGDTLQPTYYVGWRTCNGTENGTSYSMATGNNNHIASISVFRGINPAALQQTFTEITSGTTTTMTGITTPAANTVLFALVTQNSTAANVTFSSTPVPFTEVMDRVSGGRSAAAAYAIWSGSGATGSPVATWSGAARSVGLFLAIPATLPGFAGTATLSGSGTLAAPAVGYHEFTYEEGTIGNPMSSSPAVNGIVGTAAQYVATPFTGHAANAIRLDSTANNSWIRYQNFAGDTHTGSIYWRPDTLMGANNPIVSFREPGSGATGTALIGQIRQGTGASAGKIILFSGASVVAATSTAVFSNNELGRLDWNFYKHGDLYDMTVRIFKGTNVEGTTPDDTITATNMGIASAGLAFGSIMLGLFSANPAIYTYDTLRIWSGTQFWPAPYGTAALAYTGTATLGGDGTLSSVQVPRPTQTAAFSGDGTLGTVQVPRPAQAATLSGSGSLSTTAVVKPTATAALSGDGTLTTVQLPRFVIGGATFASLIQAMLPDGWWRHGEPSGTTIVDSSGNAHNGTYTGAVTLGVAGLVSGDSDTAMSTTGANTMYGTITYGSWMNRTTDIGVGIIFDTNVTTLQYLVQRWNTTAPDQLFGIDIGNTSGQVRGYLGMNGGSGNVILSTAGLNVLDGNKHMVFICWRTSDQNLRIYVDGVQAASVACTGTLRSTTDAITIGRRIGVSTNFTNGITDETYFGPALTAQQVADIWTAVTTGPTGGVALSGSGSLTTTQAPRPAQTATFSGAGTLSAVGVPASTAPGSATLSGDGQLSTTAKPTAVGTATLSGAGTLTTVQLPSWAVTATLSGAGTLITTQKPGPTQVAPLSGSGTLAVTLLVPRPTVTAPLTGDGVLTTTQVVRVIGSAVLSGSGSLAAAGTAINVTLDHMVTGIGWTDGTTYSTSVVTGTTAATSVRLKVADDSGLTTNVRYTSPVTPDANGYATHSITTIAPGGTAYYKVETTPGGALEVQLGRAKAAPTKGVAASLSLNFGSCQQTGFPGNTAIWSAVATHKTPDMWLHLGDSGYDDNVSTLQADHRANLMAQMNGRPAMAAAAYQTPSLWQRSDHDSGPGDNIAGDYNLADLAARKQIYPYPPLADATDGIYFDTWFGKIHIIVLDTRTMGRTTRGAVDNSSKTRLGATQKAWLLTKLTEPCDFLVMVCESAWVGDGWSAGTSTSGTTTNNLSIDGWVRFTNEADQIAAAIASAGLTKKMIFIAGDSHVLAADTGKNNLHGGFPSAVAAPFDRNSGGGNDGGPYTSGPYWRGSQGTLTQQFGNVSIDGTSATAVYTGWDVQDLVTPKTTLRVAADIAALSGSGTLSAVGLPKVGGPGGLSGSGTLTTTQAPRPAQIATLTGSGTLSATGIATAGATGVATLTGTGTLSPTPLPRLPGTAALSGDGSLSTTQRPTGAAVTALSGAGTLTTTQAPRPAVSAALSGSGTLSSTQAPRPAVTVTLTGTGTLSATGTASAGAAGVATLTGTGTLTTTGKPRLGVAAALGGTGVLSTVQLVRYARVVALSGTGVLSVVPAPGWARAVTFSGSGVLATTGRVTTAKAVALSGTGTLVAFGIMIIPGQQVDFVGVIPI